jgi:hypothetical protein
MMNAPEYDVEDNVPLNKVGMKKLLAERVAAGWELSHYVEGMLVFRKLQSETPTTP